MTMKKYFVWTSYLLFQVFFSFGQKNNHDSLSFKDAQTKTNVIVSKSDYLSEVNSIFRDSIKYSIVKRINSLTGNYLLERNYFVDLSYYDRTIHPKYFDQALLNLFKKNKLMVVTNGVYIKPADITKKVIRVYRCPKTAHIYCGKDWGLFYNNDLITTFEKSRNRKAYQMITCF